MKTLAVGICATVALLAAGPADAAGFRGYVTAESRSWLAEAKTRVAMPNRTITLSREDCPLEGGVCYFDRTIYTAAGYPWAPTARKFNLYHELGHAYDRNGMRPVQRRSFLRLIGLAGSCSWWGRSCRPPVGEMFAEQYAACASGVSRLAIWRSRLGLDQNDLYHAWTYNYAPPPEAESALCALIAPR